MVQERSSPSRTAGVVIRRVTLGETTYLLSQVDKVRKAADEEAVIVARRLDMLAALVSATDKLPVARQDAWRNAYIQQLIVGIASTREWQAFFGSLWKTAFRFWNALDPTEKLDPKDERGKRQRTLLDGVEWAYEIVCSDDVTVEQRESLELALDMVSQENEIKNSSGQSSELEGTRLPDNHATVAGQQ